MISVFNSLFGDSVWYVDNLEYFVLLLSLLMKIRMSIIFTFFVCFKNTIISCAGELRIDGCYKIREKRFCRREKLKLLARGVLFFHAIEEFA